MLRDSAVLWAVEEGHLRVLQLLVVFGGDINDQEEPPNFEAKWACEKGIRLRQKQLHEYAEEHADVFQWVKNMRSHFQFRFPGRLTAGAWPNKPPLAYRLREAAWPVEVALACRCHRAIRSLLAAGRINLHPETAWEDLVGVATSPGGALWSGSPAECPETLRLTRQIAAGYQRGWSPSLNFTFLPVFRFVVHLMLLIAARIDRRAGANGAVDAPPLPALPGEVLLIIIGQCGRNDWHRFCAGDVGSAWQAKVIEWWGPQGWDQANMVIIPNDWWRSKW